VGWVKPIIVAKTEAEEERKMMIMLKERLSSRSTFYVFLIGLFFVSLAIRLGWTLYVQPPGETIYSDMGGYIGRAQALVSGTQEKDPYVAVLPYGAHYYYAGLMKVFGLKNYVALSIVNAFLASATVLIVTLIARQCFHSLSGAFLSGLIAAIWFPMITFNGFFSTEVPYSFFIYLSILLSLLFLKKGGWILALVTGIVYAIGFAIRPQLIMTVVLFCIWMFFRKRHLPKLQWRNVIILVIPILCVVLFSMVRYHSFTGRWAMISGNGPVNRLFASSEYIRVVCEMDQYDGSVRKRKFQPPSARNLGYTEEFHFKGYIGDPEILNAERKRLMSEMTFAQKAALYWRNVVLLAYKNTMWPERNHAKEGARKAIFEFWPGLTKCYLFPFALIGFLILLVRLNIRMELLALHYITMLYTALMYIGEIRYRIPYDYILLLLMLYAVLVLCRIEPLRALQDFFFFKRRSLPEKDDRGVALPGQTGTRKENPVQETSLSARKVPRMALWVLFNLLLIGMVAAVFYGILSIRDYGFRTHKGKRVYYDAVHGARHLHDRDNRRYRSNYHTVSGFYRFCNALEDEGFRLFVEKQRNFTREDLNQYDVFFIGEQTYHSRYMTRQQQQWLIDWVKDGGALFALVEHTNAHYMAEAFNQLFQDAPIKVRNDSICDMNQDGPVSPSWVDIPIVKPHPVTEGVSEYRFFNGASLETPHGVLFSSPTSWSDLYSPQDSPIHNGNKQKDSQEQSGPLAGAAAFDYGEGRIVVIADHNAMSNPTLYWGDHYRFVMNSMKWLAGKHWNRDILWIPAGLLGIGILLWIRVKYPVSVSQELGSGVVALLIALTVGLCGWIHRERQFNLFIHTGNLSSMNYMTKKTPGFFSLYGQFTKEPQLLPWASKTMKEGYDCLFLSAPTKKYTSEQMRMIDDYLQRGKAVVYLATLDSLQSDAGAQLQNQFDFKVKIDPKQKLTSTRTPMNVQGDGGLLDGILRFYVYNDTPQVRVHGLKPLVQLSNGGYHIRYNQRQGKDVFYDVLSEKRVSKGRFLLLTPVEIFNDRALKNLYENADVVREQMAEAMIRLAKYAVGDQSPNLYDERQ
jgi:hypothetical protein